MEKEITKKELFEKIDALSADFAHEIEELRKQILNQPEEPQGYKGLNNWYKTNLGSIFYITRVEVNCCFGYGFYNGINSGWEKESLKCSLSEIVSLATPSEIQQAILKGCERNGIVKGAMVKSLKDSIPCQNIGVVDLISPSFYINENELWCNGIKVFDNGKFAEVAREKECTCPSVSESMNCTKVCNRTETKLSDKELLKECMDFIKNYTPSQFNALSMIILTKLNKHLNYE